jgi:O-methyltransferase involved in polyketide biosynthesis
MGHEHPERISPTAHYTGYVWFVHGQSHEAFATRAGRMMYRALKVPSVAARAAGRPTLEGMLLARHRLIDLRLAQLIDAGEVSQVVEIASGLSPRGWRLTQHFPELTYIETDLPAMAARKRALLAKVGAHHKVVELDALSETALDAVTAAIDPARGTAIITEGLINYFDHDTVTAMWARFARALRRFPRGVYLSDILLRQGNRDTRMRTFGKLLSMFVRAPVHVHFEDAAEAEHALVDAGFTPSIHDPRDFLGQLPDLELAGAGRVRVIEAVA